MEEIRAGQLVVATPGLLDPNFADTVVLLLDADTDGCLGVVLNRPTPVEVTEVLGAWGSVVTAPDVVFQGGPVGTESALAVARLRDRTDEPIGFKKIAGGLGLIDLDTPHELVDDTLEGLRVFAGYAGWGAGQLEGEVARGDWYVVPSLPADAFRDDPGGLLRDVLRRQPGERAWRSTRPADPELN